MKNFSRIATPFTEVIKWEKKEEKAFLLLKGKSTHVSVLALYLLYLISLKPLKLNAVLQVLE